MLPDELEIVNARQAKLERIAAEMQADEIARAKEWETSRGERLGVTPGATIERVTEALSEVCPPDEAEDLCDFVPHRDEVDSIRDSVENGDKMKKDNGKPRFDLIPADALFALAELYGTGAAKYYDRCWEEGMSWGRLFRAMMSHGWKWWRGEKHDPVDGQHHLIAVAWNAFALYCYEARGIGEDNRP